MTFDPLAPPPLLTADLPGIGGRIKAAARRLRGRGDPRLRAVRPGRIPLPLGREARHGRRILRPPGRPTARHPDRRHRHRRPQGPPRRHAADGLRPRRASSRAWRSSTATASASCASAGTATSSSPATCAATASASSSATSTPTTPARLPAAPRAPARAAACRTSTARSASAATARPTASGCDLLARQAAGGVSPFLRKLALSAAQSALFNRYLAGRLGDGLLRACPRRRRHGEVAVRRHVRRRGPAARAGALRGAARRCRRGRSSAARCSPPAARPPSARPTPSPRPA